MNFDAIFANLKSIRLSGGIFGKTTVLLCVVTVSACAIAWKISNPWISFAIVSLVIVIVWYSVKRCFDFAQDNPQAAIMEGQELLLHEKIVHRVKGQGDLLPKHLEDDHPLQELPDSEVLAIDASPTPELEHRSSRPLEDND